MHLQIKYINKDTAVGLKISINGIAVQVTYTYTVRISWKL